MSNKSSQVLARIVSGVLAVTAAQANALKIAEGRGTFALSLRNPEDVEVAASNDPQTLDRLLNVPVREQFTTSIYRAGSSTAVSFPGPTAIPQPTVQLPIAGVLQMRAAEQATSVEKDGSGSEGNGEPAGQAPPAAPSSETQTRAAAPPALPPAEKTAAPSVPAGAGNQAAGPRASGTDDLATVTIQIPASGQLPDKKMGSVVAKAPDSNSVAAPPAAALPQAARGNGDPVKPGTRPRKLLSDIGRRTAKQVPANRTGS